MNVLYLLKESTEMNKPIDQISFKEIGSTQKAHGLQGELSVSILDGMDLTLEQADWLFLEVEGLPLPFQLEEVKFRTDNLAILKLKLIKTQEEAKKFSGYSILIDKDLIVYDEEDFSMELLTGYTLIDQKLGTIGKILQVDDYNGNFVITVNYQNQEIMVPINDDLIISFEPTTETIVLSCPPGIFEL